MELGYTIIYVLDVLKIVDFYKKAFLLAVKAIHESNAYAEMQTGQTVLAFALEDLAKGHGLDFRSNQPSEKPAGFEIGFVTDDVKTAYETALNAGAKAVCEPAQKP